MQLGKLDKSAVGENVLLEDLTTHTIKFEYTTLDDHVQSYRESIEIPKNKTTLIGKKKILGLLVWYPALRTTNSSITSTDLILIYRQ